jgi:hypothetical protein
MPLNSTLNINGFNSQIKRMQVLTGFRINTQLYVYIPQMFRKNTLKNKNKENPKFMRVKK